MYPLIRFPVFLALSYKAHEDLTRTLTSAQQSEGTARTDQNASGVVGQRHDVPVSCEQRQENQQQQQQQQHEQQQQQKDQEAKQQQGQQAPQEIKQQEEQQHQQQQQEQDQEQQEVQKVKQRQEEEYVDGRQHQEHERLQGLVLIGVAADTHDQGGSLHPRHGLVPKAESSQLEPTTLTEPAVCGGAAANPACITCGGTDADALRAEAGAASTAGGDMCTHAHAAAVAVAADACTSAGAHGVGAASAGNAADSDAGVSLRPKWGGCIVAGAASTAGDACTRAHDGAAAVDDGACAGGSSTADLGTDTDSVVSLRPKWGASASASRLKSTPTSGFQVRSAQGCARPTGLAVALSSSKARTGAGEGRGAKGEGILRVMHLASHKNSNVISFLACTMAQL